MSISTMNRQNWRFYSRADATRQPSAWWYYGRALYVSRRDYFKIYMYIVLCLGLPLLLAGWFFERRFFLDVAFAVGMVSFIYQLYSLLGMFRMYGPPARGYLERLLQAADVAPNAVIADFHVGTYRHAYALADVLPAAKVVSIDCWEDKGRPHELAIADVRDLEVPPTHHRRIQTARTTNHVAPLANASCDAVLFGFGIHEIPTGGPREKLFSEARRILKPGGKALIFEHGNDFHNVIVFGPVIDHVTRRETWMQTMRQHFAQVGYHRSSYAVDLLWGTKDAAIGTVVAPLPHVPNWLRGLGVLAVVASVGSLTFWLATQLTGVSLYPALAALAVLGLVLPWIMLTAMRCIEAVR